MGKVVRAGSRVSCRFCEKVGVYKEPATCPEGWRVGHKAEGGSFFDCRCRDEGTAAAPTQLAIVSDARKGHTGIDLRTAETSALAFGEVPANMADVPVHDFDAISKIDDPVVRSYALQALMARYRGSVQ